MLSLDSMFEKLQTGEKIHIEVAPVSVASQFMSGRLKSLRIKTWLGRIGDSSQVVSEIIMIIGRGVWRCIDHTEGDISLLK